MTSGRGDNDFTIPGNQPGEEAIVDFDNSTEFAVAQFDTDGNATFWQTTPATYGPILVLVDGAEILGALVGFTGSQFITGQSWEHGVNVDLFINGSYVATSITDGNSEGSASPFFDLETLGTAVAAGDEVTLARSDGSRTETHIVGALTLTEIDLAADTVSGTAEPGASVFVATSWLSGGPLAGLALTAMLTASGWPTSRRPSISHRPLSVLPASPRIREAAAPRCCGSSR